MQPFTHKDSINVRNRHDRTKGEGWWTANYLTLSSNFIASRLNAALLFWFFGGFRCGVWLCFVILVRYKK